MPTTNACLTLHIQIYIIIPEVRGSIPPEASYYYLVLQHQSAYFILQKWKKRKNISNHILSNDVILPLLSFHAKACWEEKLMF